LLLPTHTIGRMVGRFSGSSLRAARPSAVGVLIDHTMINLPYHSSSLRQCPVHHGEEIDLDTPFRAGLFAVVRVALNQEAPHFAAFLASSAALP